MKIDILKIILFLSINYIFFFILLQTSHIYFLSEFHSFINFVMINRWKDKIGR